MNTDYLLVCKGYKKHPHWKPWNLFMLCTINMFLKGKNSVLKGFKEGRVTLLYRLCKFKLFFF